MKHACQHIGAGINIMSLYSELWPLQVPIDTRTTETRTCVLAPLHAPTGRLPHGARRLDDPLDEDQTEIDKQVEKDMPRMIREYEQDPDLLLKQGSLGRRIHFGSASFVSGDLGQESLVT